ncbi:MAG: glycosyltransferase, partial [Thermoanaerobaculia bacterium]|nr:glycosyltransferase [Thermoanaerobaculia bacterium]
MTGFPSQPAVDALRADLARRRVAVVHDWITGRRGGEKVLEAIFELAPGADLFTLIHLPGSTSSAIEQRRVTASWINRLPGVGRYYRWLLPLFPAAIERLDLSGYDLVMSVSHCVAKGAVARGAPHLCYCNTPMRYVWDRFDDYFGHLPAPLRFLIGLQAKRLRRWDRETASRVDGWIGNSSFVRQRIVQYYGLDEERVAVVHPPVEVERFAAARAERDDRYLVVSALVPYKRVDLAVEA